MDSYRFFACMKVLVSYTLQYIAVLFMFMVPEMHVIKGVNIFFIYRQKAA